MRITKLENKFIERGLVPLNPTLAQILLKEKYKAIQARRQILKLPVAEHMQMPELIATQGKI